MQFEWDENKRNSNIKKHGIDFRKIKHVITDPNSITEQIKGQQHREIRYKTTGTYNKNVIIIIYTERKTKCRIISARRANKTERNEYHDQK